MAPQVASSVGWVKAFASGRHAAERIARSEARMFRGEAVEGFDDLFDYDAVGVTQRAAAEGGEAGAEDHGEVDIVSRGDDFFVEAAGRFVDDRIEEALHDGFVRHRLRRR